MKYFFHFKNLRMVSIITSRIHDISYNEKKIVVILFFWFNLILFLTLIVAHLHSYFFNYIVNKFKL